MPEANVLYAVTAAVVLGLLSWVAVVLKTANEPWGRDLPRPARADDVPLETAAGDEMTSEGAPPREAGASPPASAPPSSSLPNVVAGSATGGADATADATAVVVAAKADVKPDAKGDDADDAKASDAKGDDADDAKASDAKV